MLLNIIIVFESDYDHLYRIHLIVVFYIKKNILFSLKKTSNYDFLSQISCILQQFDHHISVPIPIYYDGACRFAALMPRKQALVEFCLLDKCDPLVCKILHNKKNKKS